MAWFDGTFAANLAEMDEKFPVIVTEDLRFNTERTKMAIINRFEENTPLFDLADPHLENGFSNRKVFYHTFIDEDAQKAKRAIDEFIANGHGKGEYEVSLFRQDTNLYMYSNGELCLEQEITDDTLNAIPHEIKEKPFYILPLIPFAFRCPACHNRTLQNQSFWDICYICHWEDDGTDENDDEYPSSANGGITITEYRKEFFESQNKQ